jgi:hypothetical protein
VPYGSCNNSGMGLVGAVALAIAFEIKTHINEAQKKAKSANVAVLTMKSQAPVETRSDKKKAA